MVKLTCLIVKTCNKRQQWIDKKLQMVYMVDNGSDAVTVIAFFLNHSLPNTHFNFIVGCGLTSHSAIFQLYSDGPTLISKSIQSSKSFVVITMLIRFEN